MARVHFSEQALGRICAAIELSQIFSRFAPPRFIYDPNLALPHASQTIERSLVILKTEETLRSVAREIREQRNYHAIALLTGQSRALKQAGEERKDRELLRDAAILAKYADRLYEWLRPHPGDHR